jgi:hypothetical protein
MLIDTSFDFRTDASGKDPDVYSPTLRRYHKLLWSKALPGGRLFDLDDTIRGVYLHHRSELGQFFLCSDSVIPTFTRWDSLRRITELFTEEENEAFRTIGYTIGGMMVFPGNRIDGKQTINGARGFNRTRTGSTSRSSVSVGTTSASGAPSVRRWAGTATFSRCSRTSGGTSNSSCCKTWSPTAPR